jgi:hypothetical protein
VKLFGFLRIMIERQGPEKGTFILLLGLGVTFVQVGKGSVECNGDCVIC